MDGKTCDNNLAMAEHFNHYFCAMCKRLAGKMKNNSSQSVTRCLMTEFPPQYFLNWLMKENY